MSVTTSAWQAAIASLRERAWAQRFVAFLRIAIGFAFVPAGLKKILGQAFTDSDKVGVFHDFVRIFHDTGGFYNFVGFMQLLAAALLMTQRFASLGAAIAFPILVTIFVFVWSTAGLPTCIVVSLMTAGCAGLLLWDWQRWWGLFSSNKDSFEISQSPSAPVIARGIWEKCGAAILLVYFAATLWQGGVYRPRRMEWDSLNFYLLPTLLLFPVIALVVDLRKSRKKRN